MQICVLWAIVDMTISFTFRIYISIGYYLKTNGEIKKNITTLISV